MSEQDRELIDMVKQLPEELRENLINRVEGALEALQIVREKS